MISPLARLGGALAAAACAFLFAAATAFAEPNIAISTTEIGGTGDGPSFASRWDRNGRFAIFLSQAPNLVPGQSTPSALNSLFLFDRLAGTLKLVSHIPGNPVAGPDSGVLFDSQQISADGNWVVYVSEATNLVAGQVDGNADRDVFLWNRVTDTTLLVSHSANSATTAGDLSSGNKPNVSGDGRYVTYTSLASLVTGQITNTFTQIFQFDRTTGANVLVSHAFNNPLRSSNEECARPSSSANGRWVAFDTLATNLVDGTTDSNGGTDVYLWDRDAGALRLLSRRSGFPLSAGNGASDRPQVSADGTGVAFRSLATNLEGASSDTNGGVDIFHYEQPADLVRLVSHRANSSTGTGNGGTGDRIPSISADGDRVAFLSLATDHVASQLDTNGATDVFLWQSGPLTLISHLSSFPTTAANAVSTDQLIAPDGQGVAFASRATNLVGGVTDTNGSVDVFFRPRNQAQVTLISHVPDETATINSGSTLEAVAVGGALVAFSTGADDVIGDDGNGFEDVFLHGSLVMADGFESGDLSAWSQHFP